LQYFNGSRLFGPRWTIPELACATALNRPTIISKVPRVGPNSNARPTDQLREF
jgi:hypothetical protein